MFKLLAKPEYGEDEENIELDKRMGNVKEMLTDSAAFKKLKQDEFYKLVNIFSDMDQLSSEIYLEDWKIVGEDERPLFSKK